MIQVALTKDDHFSKTFLLRSSASTVAKVKIVMTDKKGLKTYQIEVIETMSALIEVVAEDGETAMLEAQERYRNEDIVLYPDDFIDTKFIIFGVE